MRISTDWVITPYALGTMMIGLAVTGCGFSSPAGNVDAAIVDTPMLDIDAGAPIDARAECFGGGVVQICVQTLPTTAVTLGDQTIDTGSSPMCVEYTSIPTGVQACVIAGTMISLPTGTFRATGSRPLVMIASGNIGISNNATVDVASHLGGTVGAAGNTSQCAAGTPPAQVAGTGGGGYGGSFGGGGGTGNVGAAGGVGGIATLASGVPTVLRGGCPGSPGANGNAGGGAGTAGNGGGAVLLIARGMIRIDGEINASGSAGGGGNSTQAGAGGGGSGGMIALDAPTVTVAGGAHLWANGGGGGEGGSSGVSGAPGKDSTGPATAGFGGTGGANTGGDGGAGSVSGTIGGSNGNAGSFMGLNAGGGGAGGGGAGVILIRATTTSGTGNTNNVAPPPS